MHTLDWLIIAGFVVVIIIIAVVTNRMTKSVAGFLSSERLAGRYLLTIAGSMAFASAIGTVGAFEGGYRNGIGGFWWNMLMGPIGLLIALSGWVTYRYRETRSLTMAQFLEKRYSKRFRVFAGIIAFVSGMLNCAVFPMVTAYLMIYFLQLPSHWAIGPLEVPMYHTVMLILVGSGVTLAIAGGQITIMVTDFVQGVIATAAVLSIFCFVLYKFGVDGIMDTLMQSENISALEVDPATSPQWFIEATEPMRDLYQSVTAMDPEVFETLRANNEAGFKAVEALVESPQSTTDLAVVQELGIAQPMLEALHADMDSARLIVKEQYPDMITKLKRPEGVSMMNPFKLGKLPDFGVPYFIMMALLMFAKQGVWQGNAGYQTAARTPHEGKMGGLLGGWRWMMLGLGTFAVVTSCYTLLWNAAYPVDQAAIQAAANNITDPFRQSQQFVPVMLSQLLPAGLMGLFAIYMIGASVSTDDSAYHSWGSIFLQDVVMPFRKRPFEKEEHLKWLRWSIVGVGGFAFLFSSIWTLKDFIQMWFEITGAIYFGGAACAIIGGLYWSRGTTQGAWSGLITGGTISITGIIVKQIWPDMTFPWSDTIINGLHIAVFNVFVSFSVYITVSLITCGEKFNLKRMLHRGEYDTAGDHVVKNAHQNWLLRKIGITYEFSFFDKCLYIMMICWTTTWTTVFILGTIYNYPASNALLNNAVDSTGFLSTLVRDRLGLQLQPFTSEDWKYWMTLMLGVQGTVAIISGIWFALGGARDVTRLYKALGKKEVDDSDDGWVEKETV